MNKLACVLILAAMVAFGATSQAEAQPSTGTFVYPVGDGTMDGYSIIQGFNTSYTEGYCVADTPSRRYSSQECVQLSATWLYGHDGIDINQTGDADCGDIVRASGVGRVVQSDTNTGFGNFIRILHNTQEGARYIQSGHMQSRAIMRGQHVECCQKIGRVGTTGVSGGCHIHQSVLAEDRMGSGYYGDNMPGYMLDPIVFYISHAPPAVQQGESIGVLPDQHSTYDLPAQELGELSGSFLCPYRCNGSTPFFGPPSAIGTNTTVYVHAWGTDTANRPLLVQDFLRPLGGGRSYWSQLQYNHTLGTALPVHGKILEMYARCKNDGSCISNYPSTHDFGAPRNTGY